MLKWVVYVRCCCYFNRPFSLFFCKALWCVGVGIYTEIFVVWSDPPECIQYIWYILSCQASKICGLPINLRYIKKPLLKIHNWEKSNKCNQYECASSWAGHLRRHLKTHTGKKSNQCNQCEYTCSDPSALRTHLKIHTGEKTNKCNQCTLGPLQWKDGNRRFFFIFKKKHDHFKAKCHFLIREARLYQNWWIFGKVSKGSFPIPKKMLHFFLH